MSSKKKKNGSKKPQSSQNARSSGNNRPAKDLSSSAKAADGTMYYDDFGQDEDTAAASEEFAPEQAGDVRGDGAYYEETVDDDYYDEDDSGTDYDEPDFDRSREEDDAEEYGEDDNADGADADNGVDAGNGAAGVGVDSLIPESLRPYIEKCREYSEKLDRRLYKTYFRPDKSKLVSQKTTVIAFAAAAAAALLLGFAVIIFLGTYPFHTTGMKTKDFIREFNAISSDTDIRTIVPSFTDVVIPENAKLGKEPVYLAEGHVKLSARTRFGRIIELQVEGIDLPNYDERNYSFISNYSSDYDYSNKQFYYYIALGKAAIAAEKLIPTEQPENDASGSDTSSSDQYNIDYVPTIYEAASYGYQLYYYAYYYYANQLNSGYLYLPMGKSYLYYELSEERLTIKPVIEKITNLPDGLQRFWDGLTGKNKKDEQDAEADTSEQPALGESTGEDETPAENTDAAGQTADTAPSADTAATTQAPEAVG